jgi:hypothetical protein
VKKFIVALIGVALTLIGIGLFVHGILSYEVKPQSPFGISQGAGWSDDARLECAVGAALAIGGSLLYRARN